MTDVTVFAIPVFVLTLILEGFILYKKGTPYEAKDTAASLSGGLGSVVVKAFWKVITFWCYSALYEYRLFEVGTGVAAWIMLIFAEDLIYYIYHRSCHEIRFFWAQHVVHHSSQRYTLGTALRQSWTAPIFGMIFWFPLPLLGFKPEMIFMMSGFSLIYQYWIHTETIRTLGPIEWIMNTPSHHRVHHGKNPQYIDKNHAGIFIIWDRLFGTFEPEGETVQYGITKDVGSYNPVYIQFHEYIAMIREVFTATSWRARWTAVFGRPTGLS